MRQTLWELLRKHKIDLTTAQHICNDALVNGVSTPCTAARIEQLEAALREIETICIESAGDCRKRMGTRVGNTIVAARAALTPEQDK